MSKVRQIPAANKGCRMYHTPVTGLVCVVKKRNETGVSFRSRCAEARKGLRKTDTYLRRFGGYSK